MAERYKRQTRFGPIGEKGQKKIRAARVTLIGCGALGSSIADHLVRAGVGSLRLCDRDFVELHNLNSQVLYDQADVEANLPKAVAARAKLQRINSEVDIDARVTDVNYANVESLVQDADLVLDGTDNFETRFLLNDACVKHGVPWIYGGVVASYGMMMAVRPGEGPCYACLLPEMPQPGSSPTCDTAGVINTAVSLVSALQCTEAIKLLTGNTEALVHELVNIDVWTNQFSSFRVKQQPDCRACAKKEFSYLEAKGSGSATTLCGRQSVQVVPGGEVTLPLEEVEKKLSPLGTVSRNEFLVKAGIDGYELTIFPDGRAIIKGTDDPAAARTVYSKYVGS